MCKCLSGVYVEQTRAGWGGAQDIHQRWLNTPLSPSNFLYHANGAAMPVLLINLSAAGGREALLADAQKAIKHGAAGGDGERQIKGWTNQRKELWGNKHMVSETMKFLLCKNESDNRQVNWNWCEKHKAGLKGSFTQQCKFSHHLFTLMSFWIPTPFSLET